jgi:hypothetical protein
MPRQRRKPATAHVPYQVRRLESWDELLDAITLPPYSDWAFRGQADERWPLESKLSRYFRNFHVDARAWPEQEDRILRIFKRKAHLFLNQPPDHEDELQWLAMMQHHGAPTRLLDFTWSPYVAAFFALEHATADAAIWALNPGPLSYAPVQKIESGRLIRPPKLNPRLRGNLRSYFLRGKTPFIWVGEPQVMNRRLIAQSGTFAIPSVLTRPLEDILSGYPDPANTLVKFVLRSDRIRGKALRELYRMKITNEALFPDLDGLARSLAYELEFHWRYDPHTAQRRPD